MIITVIIVIIRNILNVLLFPLDLINIGTNFLINISFVQQFFKVASFIIPFNNILPLIILTIGLFAFRIAIILIKSLWELIPIL